MNRWHSHRSTRGRAHRRWARFETEPPNRSSLRGTESEKISICLKVSNHTESSSIERIFSWRCPGRAFVKFAINFLVLWGATPVRPTADHGHTHYSHDHSKYERNQVYDWPLCVAIIRGQCLIIKRIRFSITIRQRMIRQRMIFALAVSFLFSAASANVLNDLDLSTGTVISPGSSSSCVGVSVDRC